MSEPDFGDVLRRLDLVEKTLSRVSELEDLIRRISPVDPPPDDISRIDREGIRSRVMEIVRRNPGWITDPPPEDFLNVRVLDLIRRFRGGFSDPAPDDIANVRLGDILHRIPGGGVSDPPPSDISRLGRVELESQLHKINSEMVRLKSLERLISERLKEIKH